MERNQHIPNSKKEKMLISGVYIIYNLKSQKGYVGSAVDIIGRWYDHRRDLNMKKHHSILLQTEETKRKMSESKKGKKKSLEHRKNLSKAGFKRYQKGETLWLEENQEKLVLYQND